MNNSRPFIIVFTDYAGGVRYQTEESHFTDTAFETVADALDSIVSILQDGDVVSDKNTIVFILNTNTGETYQYKPQEIPRAFVMKAI